MNESSTLTAWVLRREGWLVFLAGMLAFVSIPLSLGYLGLSWDALNHHIYLGWTAEQPRFDRDYLAAAYQSYQYPYLYWPVYKLAIAGVSGTTAGVVLALLHATAIPAVWMIARSCIPGEDLFNAFMRLVALALAFATAAVLSLFDSTSNDLTAAIPLLWAYALALRPFDVPAAAAAHRFRPAAVSGILAGMSVAFKMSNGFLVLAMPLLWLLAPGAWRTRLAATTLGCACVLAGCAVFYGYWGWQLWTHFGNPVYPLYDGRFAPLREWLGWRP